MNDKYAGATAPEDQRTTMRRLRYFHESGPLHLLVHSWLAPITIHEPFHRYSRTQDEAYSNFQRVTDVVEGALPHDRRLAEVLDMMADQVAQPILEQHLSLFADARRRDSHLLKTYLSVVYARTLHMLRNEWYGTPESMADINRWLTGDGVEKTGAHLQKRMTDLGPHFIGHLLMASEYRATEDPDFQHRLDTAWSAFEGGVGSGATAAPSARRTMQLDALAAPRSYSRLALEAHIAFAFTIWD